MNIYHAIWRGGLLRNRQNITARDAGDTIVHGGCFPQGSTRQPEAPCFPNPLQETWGLWLPFTGIRTWPWSDRNLCPIFPASGLSFSITSDSGYPSESLRRVFLYRTAVSCPAQILSPPWGRIPESCLHCTRRPSTAQTPYPPLRPEVW